MRDRPAAYGFPIGEVSSLEENIVSASRRSRSGDSAPSPGFMPPVRVVCYDGVWRYYYIGSA